AAPAAGTRPRRDDGAALTVRPANLRMRHRPRRADALGTAGQPVRVRQPLRPGHGRGATTGPR
ncbi:hypothetical protein ABZ923_34600, partial [Streptomyces sp. NPDC046881]|uniref:hypothetical protein n=1 Tax=Streptomyces sp. NPDC046881 TaxID=3155374 RepID=UPI0033ECBB14